MITKTISDKFYGGGVQINPSKKEDICKLDYNIIVNLFEKNGFILFRDFNIASDGIIKFTDLYTESYSNDALRRNVRMNKKEIRSVDPGQHAIKLHSEASFSPDWPEILWFFCNEFSSNNGGNTIFCDGMKLWDNLSYEVKNFFLLNPIKYKLRIPVSKKKLGKGNKKWFLNYQGTGNCSLDMSNSTLNVTQLRFGVHPSRLQNKMCFSNHIISSMYQGTDPTILEWSKVPQNILDETSRKAEEITYDFSWKKNDLIMVDNKRFMHGRRALKKIEKRDIIVIQSSLANFGYGSTTRKKIN